MSIYKRHRFPPETFSNPWPISAAFPSRALLKLPKNSRADILQGLDKSMGPPRGLEITDIPDEVDELDADGAVEGLGVDGRRRLRRVV